MPPKISQNGDVWRIALKPGKPICLAATVRMWQVFPFDFGSSSFDWALLVRILLVLGIVGVVIVGGVTALVEVTGVLKIRRQVPVEDAGLRAAVLESVQNRFALQACVQHRFLPGQDPCGQSDESAQLHD